MELSAYEHQQVDFIISSLLCWYYLARHKQADIDVQSRLALGN